MKRTKKKKVIQDFAIHPSDTGSPQVQIAILTERIKHLTKHLEKNPSDNHSRYGLLQMVGKRRKLMNYLKVQKAKEYEELIKKLQLK